MSGRVHRRLITAMSRINAVVLVGFTIITAASTVMAVENPTVFHTVAYPALAVMWAWLSWSNLRYANSLREEEDTR